MKIWLSLFLMCGFVLTARAQGFEPMRISRDAGKTWKVVDCGMREPMFDLEFVDSKTGYASGRYGTLLFTADGGKSWKKRKLQLVTEMPQFGQDVVNKSSLVKVCFADAKNGLLFTEEGKVYRTADGGETIDEVWAEELNGLRIDEMAGNRSVQHQGMVVNVLIDNRKLARSSDMGKTWSVRELPMGARQLYLWGGELFYETQNGPQEVVDVYGSKNQGATWEKLNLKPMTGSFFYWPGKAYWAFDSESQEGMTISVANGMGSDWKKLKKLDSGWLSPNVLLAAADGNKMLCLGHGKGMIASYDAGKTWTFTEYRYETVMDAVFLDDNTVLAVGSNNW